MSSHLLGNLKRFATKLELLTWPTADIVFATNDDDVCSFVKLMSLMPMMMMTDTNGLALKAAGALID